MTKTQDILELEKLYPCSHEDRDLYIVCKHMFNGAGVYVWSRSGQVLHCSQCDCRKWAAMLPHEIPARTVCGRCLAQYFPDLPEQDVFPDS